MYVYRLVFVITILILSPHVFGKTFAEDDLKFRWLSAYKIESLYGGKIFKGPIEKPKATWHPILAIYLHDINFIPQKKDCLIYFIPGDDTQGKLRIVEAKLKEKCEKLIFSPSFLEKDKIFNFSFNLTKTKLTLYLDQESYQYKYYSKNQNINIGTLKPRNKNIFLSDGDICFEVDDQCNSVLENNCHLCPNGSFDFVASSCSRLYKKKCGENNCGIKGGPACIRGFKTCLLYTSPSPRD